ncbi:hypothetical protein H0H93_010179 [Arthromyces matolae]|nr:hypothetical protein H0H93_010179 [Arthromyces matolae]
MPHTELPYAADAEMSLTYDELEVLRLQYEKELTQAHVTVQTKFNYSWGLVKSPMREHQVEGVRLLQEQKPLAVESAFTTLRWVTSRWGISKRPDVSTVRIVTLDSLHAVRNAASQVCFWRKNHQICKRNLSPR